MAFYVRHNEELTSIKNERLGLCFKAEKNDCCAIFHAYNQ